jgi:hypothetical protein
MSLQIFAQHAKQEQGLIIKVKNQGILHNTM